jgi:hypothetical protein
MNQSEFHRAVAQATGESVETIARRGFVLLQPVPFEREPRGVDYEAFLRREGVSPGRRPPNRLAG